jgi:hypothetical protein
MLWMGGCESVALNRHFIGLLPASANTKLYDFSLPSTMRPYLISIVIDCIKSATIATMRRH